MTEVRSSRPGAIDVVLAGSLCAISVLSGLFIQTQRAGIVAPAGWWQWLLLSTPSLLVVFRRTHPMIVTPLAVLAQMAIWMLGLPDVFLPIIILLYSVASEGSRRALNLAIASGVALTAVTGLGVLVAEDVTIHMLPLAALTVAVSIILGSNAAAQRERAAILATDLAVLRLSETADLEQNIRSERERIAREMHDIVGHNLSIIAVHAEAADRVADRRPEAAAGAVADIARTARGALDEMRQVLLGLRGDSEMELAPTPALTSLQSLVDDVNAAGIEVAFTNRVSEGRIVPATVAAGVYRIVQEALTNVLKHAGPGVKVAVVLSESAASLDVEVSDDGRGSVARSVRPGSGFGLVGMAERADVLGGTFTAGPHPGGGFAVLATLPLPELPVTNHSNGLAVT